MNNFIKDKKCIVCKNDLIEETNPLSSHKNLLCDKFHFEINVYRETNLQIVVNSGDYSIIIDKYNTYVWINLRDPTFHKYDLKIDFGYIQIDLDDFQDIKSFLTKVKIINEFS